MKQFLLTLAPVTAFVSPASAEEGTIPHPNEIWLLQLSGTTQCCATDDGDTVTLHGTIVQSSGAQKGTGKKVKFMDIALDTPFCTDKLVGVDVSKKWLGHHVVVTGIIVQTGFGAGINIKHISDDKETK